MGGHYPITEPCRLPYAAAMPVYDYRCNACGATLEALRPHLAADQAVTCPCGATDSTRLPSLISRPQGSSNGGQLPIAGSPSGGGCCGGGCGCAS